VAKSGDKFFHSGSRLLGCTPGASGRFGRCLDVCTREWQFLRFAPRRVCANEHSRRGIAAPHARHAVRTESDPHIHDQNREAIMEQRGQRMTGQNGGASALGSEAQVQLEELRQRVGEINERVVTFIKERPGTALLIAAGAGFLIGRILRS
jgi:hypothetical protein